MAQRQIESIAAWRTAFVFFAALALAGCNAAQPPPPASGITVVLPLTGQESSNQLQFLERIRHLPKRAVFERRTFTSSSKPAAQIKFLFFKPKGFQPEQSYPLVL